MSNRLVDEENEMRRAGFSKLNLPEEEMLKTETNSQSFPEHNHPIESNVKIDPVAVGESLKTTGKGVLTTMKNLYTKAKEFRQKRQEEKAQKRRALPRRRVDSSAK